MDTPFRAFPPDRVGLLPGLLRDRFALNRRYVMSLSVDALLQNHRGQAGLWSRQLRSTTHRREADFGDDMHWGWESPSCQLRGHFLGHWLSAAARIAACTGDGEAKARVDTVVEELARCQVENGDGWVGSIPREYLDWVARGKGVWAPHYTLHKTLMGLYDAYAFTGSERALHVLTEAAGWFSRWTERFSREQMDDILDAETGGMMESWANLYGATGNPAHLELMRRYERRRLFDRLLAGDDPLTNRHMNTTVPEALGAARAYEVTGDERYLQIVRAYWRCGVTDRGFFCTGGQSSGEIWTPPFRFAARLGEKTQEHCCVYNMMLLADFLFRHDGEPEYADYIERNLYNGILAQQHPGTGMIAYFLPLHPGARKHWGSPTHDFWCCHGSLVQAHTVHNAYTYYDGNDGISVCQYTPASLNCRRGDIPVRLRQTPDTGACNVQTFVQSHRQDIAIAEAVDRPRWLAVTLEIDCDAPVEFTLRLRLPWWLNGPASIDVNGQPEPIAATPPGFHEIRRTWHHDRVGVILPKTLTACPLPDEPGTVAFLDGPVVLGGLCGEERTLNGNPADPASMLAPANERQWGVWLNNWRTVGQDRRIDFKPLYEICDEPYTVYFPVKSL